MRWKKTKSPFLLLISALLLTSPPAMVVAGVGENHFADVFFSRAYEEEVVGLEGSLTVSPSCKDSRYVSYCTLDQNNPATGKTTPGRPYTGRGCDTIHQCRQGQ